jgi:hypothetical protein
MTLVECDVCMLHIPFDQYQAHADWHSTQIDADWHSTQIDRLAAAAALGWMRQVVLEGRGGDGGEREREGLSPEVMRVLRGIVIVDVGVELDAQAWEHEEQEQEQEQERGARRALVADVAQTLEPVPSEVARAMGPDDVCPVCLQEFREQSDGALSKLRACCHVFCTRCITDWLVRGRGDCCPVCKAPCVLCSASAHGGGGGELRRS